MSDVERVARLERRIERERRARAEAEEIAERGMRDLWLANRDLESRVEERTAELERSLVAARQASAAKEAFLADLGHDLATPLHAVLGHLELVDRTALGPDDRSGLDTAMTNARQLATLLRGLVDLAGAEGAIGPDEVERRSPAAWLDDLVDGWRRRSAARGQLLLPACLAPPDELTAPWSRLRQIMDLLIDNTIVHGSPGPVRVEVEIESSRPDDVRPTVVCRVIDSGPGLDDDQLLTVLEPFVGFGERAGLGVGLACADRLARGAAGALSLVSTDGTTTATVSIPAGPIDASPAS